MACISSKLF